MAVDGEEGEPPKYPYTCGESVAVAAGTARLLRRGGGGRRRTAEKGSVLRCAAPPKYPSRGEAGEPVEAEKRLRRLRRSTAVEARAEQRTAARPCGGEGRRAAVPLVSLARGSRRGSGAGGSAAEVEAKHRS